MSILTDAEQKWQPVSFVLSSTGLLGRHRFDISKDQLWYLIGYDSKMGSQFFFRSCATKLVFAYF